MRRVFILALLFSAAAGAESRSLTILHTGDLHARTLPDSRNRGGFAYVAAALRQESAGCGHCVHLGAGDLVTGSPVSTIFRGVPVFEMANELGLDAFTLGNHEFDHGWQQVAALRKEAEFPIVTANVFGPDGKPLADSRYIILRVNGLRVGVIGAVMGNLATGYLTPKTAGPIRVTPVVETVRQVARQIGKQVDVVLVLGHILPSEGSAILREVPEVHVVVEGHNHGGVPEMEQVEDRVRVGVRGYGVEIGRLDLQVDTEKRKLQSAMWKTIPVETAKLQPAADVAALIEKWERRVSEVVDKPIAETRRNLDPPEVLKLIERAIREEMNADFTSMNRGGVRDRLTKGVIREREIWNIMPFDNLMMVARVKGRDVPEALRRGATVDPNREYVIALHDFSVGNDSIRRELGIEGITFEPTDRQLRQLLIDWIRKQKVLE